MLSKKMKTQLKKIAVNTTLAVSAMVVLFVMCVNLDGRMNKSENKVGLVNNQGVGAGNQVEVIKDSNGISVKVRAEDNSGVTSIEVLQGSTSVGTYNFSGSNAVEEKTVGLSVPFGESREFTIKVNGNTVSQETVENMRCISTAQDLKKFRDLVNTDYTFNGKYVELTNDIDLSSVCSSNLGSWVPIGNGKNFMGTFNGNGHTISSLFINDPSLTNYGLFGCIFGALVENVTVAGEINTTANSGGGVAHYSANSTFYRVINKVNVSTNQIAGGVIGAASDTDRDIKFINCANTGNITVRSGIYNGYCGGIVGYAINMNSVEFESCYNNGAITSRATAYEGFTGGILGETDGVRSLKITNCYNVGTLSSNPGFSGGIVGYANNYYKKYTMYITIQNCYSIGIESTNSHKGGVISWADGGSYLSLNTSNVYWANNVGATAGIVNYSSQAGIVGTAKENIKGITATLGNKNWVVDSYGLNNGYPILRWQIPSFDLNVKQTYMHVGDTLQLTVDTSKSSVELGSITWASYDSSIAQIDSTGKVTATGEGTTTVYAVESTYTLKAMAIINVAKNGAVAMAQVEHAGIDADNIGRYGETVETSEFTAVLKEDGTVWTSGCNTYGALGNGTYVDSKEPVQVKIDSKTYLSNIIKISVGYNNVIALTSDGYVYAWGANSKGQLGIGNTTNQNYACKVLGLNGEGYLNNIVDIATSTDHCLAVGKDGTMYSWGRNKLGDNFYGALGIGNTTDYKSLPQVPPTDKVIDVSTGAYYSVGLRQCGNVISSGFNGAGRLGIGSTVNQTLFQYTDTNNIIEISAGMMHTAIKNISGEVYVTGSNGSGQFGNGTTISSTVYTKSTLPSSVNSTNKVKYVRGHGANTSLLLDNGTIWITGNNEFKQISNGSNDTYITNYVQSKNSNGSYITNAKNIGKCATAGGVYDQTLVYNDNDGFVYSVASNPFGQFGNGTTTNSNYYTRMGVPYLNYLKDDIIIGVDDIYTINRNDFKIEEFNVSIDYNGKAAGTLAFSTTDSNITVDSSTGRVTGIAEGYARVKVTDTTNNYTTYVIVKVVNDNKEQLELGSKFSVGLRTNGEVWTWGSNTYGELGLDSNEAYEDKPLQVETLSNIVDIGAGNYHAVAVDEDGYVYTWGLNNSGQLGNGNTTDEKKPVKLSGLSDIVKVDAYKNTTTALDSDGNLYAWGEGYDKTPQIIYTDVKDFSENVLLTKDRRIMRFDGSIVPVVKNVVKIARNDNSILAILDNGQVISIDDSDTVTNLSVTNAVDVSCGNGYSYILDQSKNVYTYGSNSNGELGNGANTATTAPARVSVSDAEIIAAGEGSHGAIGTFDGSIYTTGLNDKGQLGHGDVDNKNTFELLLNVALESNVDKVVEEIGESQIVDIGLGITLNLKKDLRENSTSNILIVDDTIASLRENPNNTYTVTGLAWGRTFLNATITGEINGEHKEFATNVEVRVVPEGGITIPQIKSGDGFTIALKANGEVEAWGKNIYGQLGIGNTTNYDEPQKLSQLDETIVEIAVGNNHVIALTENGNIYGWGLNNNGQVGNGTTANQVSQATVINISGNELSKIIRVEAHGDNSFAINEDGDVWAWGKDFGNKATKLTDLKNVIDVSTSYFVKADGTAYRMSDLSKLTIVGTVRAMDEGVDHAVFLTTEGKAYAIGSNDYGQLGNGSTDVASTSVVAIRKDENHVFEDVVAIEAGDRYTLIQTADGSVYTTGLNENGRLGLDLSTINVITPVKNTNISNVILISAGEDHAVVAKQDGTVYSWGKGTIGELGNRMMKDSVTPVMVGPYIIRTDKKNIVIGKNDSTIVKGYVDYFNILNKEVININSISKNTQVARVSNMTATEAELTEDEVNAGYKAFKIEGINPGTTNIVLSENKANTNGILQVEVLPEAGITISPMVETASSFVATLKTNGTVWTYGQNTYGELGTGDNVNYDEPQQVIFPEGTVIKQIAVGEYHVAALDTEGNIWTWGRNNFYQLGVSSTSESNTPIKVTGIPKATRITAGTNSVMAVTEDNRLVAWGQNAYGELGNGQNVNKTTPVIIEGVHDVLDVQGGKNHYLVLKTTGELFTTGSNLYGQLGQDIGERTRINTFNKIPSNLKYGSIAAGQTSNVAITIDGVAYVWGQNTFGNLGTGEKNNVFVPTQVPGLTGIVEADVGKTHTILRDYNEDIYLAGTNANGQLGNGTSNNNFTFAKNLKIEDVLRVSAGYTYTAVMKKDGTVWAWGDYNHGNRVLNSRTNSKIPVQIGSDTSSLDKLEIVIKKSEIESILANSEFRFNLIYEDQNKTSNFSYESLNTEIAEVNQDGNVLGVREGSTWVKVTDNETGKVSVAIIRVIDNVEGYSTYTSPKVVTGENYAVALKEDGNIDLWGYDDSQMVDSDIPYTINVVATYVNVLSGKNHLIALRNDGTVWTAGDNTYGQLGKTGTSINTKLTQIQNLTNVEKIAAGDNFCVAMDNYGITYVWGEGFGTTPQVLDTNIRSISYLSAGSKDQIIMILPSGEVYGQGSILNGTIRNFDRAVKVEVGTDYLLILDTNGNVYKYQNGVLTKQEYISNAIDISVKDNVNMYQKVNEKVYSWGTNNEGQLGTNDRDNKQVAVMPENNGNNVYTISAGPKNTYIIDTNGYVYASGANNLGQIGNGTKENLESSSYQRTLTHTIVGTRGFDIDPISSIMEVNDVDDLTIIGNTYNVFKKENVKDINEYNVSVEDTNIIELLEEDSTLTGEIKALNPGLTNIEVTDKVTGEKVTASRKVVPMDQNRIFTITADGVSAVAQTPSNVDKYIFGYTVDVPMDDDETRVNLIIQAKDSSDVISIDEGVTYSDSAILNTTVEIPTTDRTLTVPITIKATNGTEFMYELVINRISTNNNVASVTVNGYNATLNPSEDNVYEIVITDLGDNQITVTSEDTNANVSIRGKVSEPATQSLETTIPNGKIEVPFKVISESGKAKNYTLRMYTTEELLKLKQLKVNDKLATLEEDGTYSMIIADDVSRSKIYAQAKYDTTYVGINESEKELSELTKNQVTTIDENTATIELQATALIDGTEQTISRTYTLKIYKNKKFSFIDFVTVNGETIEEENNTYVAYVLSNISNAGIRIKAKEATYEITLGDTVANGTLIKAETLANEENTYTFTVENDDDETKTYTLKIIRGSTDTRLKKVTVGSGDYVIEAEHTEEKIDDKEVYEVDILSSYNNVDVTAQTANRYSKVDVNNTGTFTTKIVVENIDINSKTTLVSITVKSADEATSKDYYLRITTVDDDTSINSIAVNELLGNPDIIATLENENDDTRYEVHLQNPVTEVEIKAALGNAYSKVSINNEIESNSINITLTSSITEVPIKVISEYGTEKTYYLTIYTISDDTSLESLTVNGIPATWNSTLGRYEIKVDGGLTGYDIIATTVNNAAKVSVNGTENVHQTTKHVTNEGDETVVNLKVTAANEITSTATKLAVIEKSNNTGLGYVKVNGVSLAHDDQGNYKYEVVSTVQSVIIEVGAQDGNASINMAGEVQQRVWKGTKVLQTDREIYDVYIIAEDGTTTSNTFTITIVRLDGNTKIAAVEVIYTKNSSDVTETPVKQEDGSYYLELPKIDEDRVALRITLEQSKSTVNVLGTEGTGSLYGYVNLTGEITRVPIKVTAEDGTSYQTYLILEKESNDTSLKELSAQGYTITKTDSGYEVIVDSKLDKLNITAIPKKPKAKVKVSTDTNYSAKLDNQEVSIAGKDEILFSVLAEDGETTGLHSLEILRTYDTSIISAKVNNNDVNLGGIVNLIGNTTGNIEITTKNNDAEIYLIKDNTQIATGIGTLTIAETIGEETVSEYSIVVRGPGQYDNYENTYTLKLRKQATDTSAVIYVDGNPVTKNNDTGKYEAVVTGTYHEISAEATSNFTTIKIDDVITSIKGISVGPKTTTNYVVKVIAEDGTEQEYPVQIYRKNNDTSIKEVKLKLTETSEESTLIPLGDGSYYYKVPRNQQTVFVSLETTDTNATAVISPSQALNNIIKEVDIDQNAEVTNIPLKVIAEDGTENTVNLKLEKESNDTSLREVRYDGKVIEPVQDESYTIEVDNRLTNIAISAIPTNANAKIKVVGADNYVSTLSDENVDITGENSFEIEVLAEDGETTKRYTININRIFSTKVTKVEVDNEEINPSGTSYSTFVDATAENHTIKITPNNSEAVITIYDNEDNELITGTGTVTLTDTFAEDSKVYKVKVQGPTGFTEFESNYTITLNKKSQDTSAKVYINDVEIIKDEDTGKYRLVTKVSNNKVKVEATSNYAKVSIDEKPYRAKSDEQNYVVNVRETKLITAKVTSQNGEEETYEIVIIRLDNNTNITSITVNDETVNKVTDTIYRKALPTSEYQARVKIIAEYELSSISAELAGGATYTDSGELEFDVNLPGSGTTEVRITVTAQDGTQKTYTLNIVQNATENLDLTVKVNSLDADKLDDSSYRIFVENTLTEVGVNIKAVDEHTTISVNDLNSNDVTFNKTLSTSGDITLVNFTATTELGTSKDYMLYIIKESNDNAIQKLYVNNIEITKGDNGRYTTYIDNTQGNPTVKVKANNEYAYVRIGTNERELQQSEKVVKLSEERTTTVPIMVYSQSGVLNTEYLDIITTFAVGNIDSLIVDDVEVTNYNEATRTFTAMVENTINEHEIQLLADNNYVTLELADAVGIGSVTSVVQFAEGEEVKTLTLYVTGETDLTQEYTVVLAQKSSNVELSQVKVNDVTLQEESGHVFAKNIDLGAKKVKIEVTAEYPYATIKVGDTEVKTGATGTVWLDIEVTQDEITIPVVVTAADGITLRTYNIILTRKASYIKGNVITDNWEDIHITDIYVYRTADKRAIDDPESPRELVYYTKSKEDGSYVLELPNADNYDVIFKKLGYLDAELQSVTAQAYTSVNAQTIKLKAGDIDGNGEIELDDLVEFNEHNGENVISSNKLYDLNEDGVIDIKDRTLIKENYHSKKQIVKWLNANEITLIKPLDDGYTITSDYGYRVDPIKNITAFHSGVDLRGPHHGNIYAVADGEVTYAGVQSSYGNCVEIKHIVNGETIYSFYAHMSQIDVQVGDTVTQGQTIGLEGGDPATDPNPGRTTGHHLHFEIRSNSGYTNNVNPHDYMEL